MEKQFLCEECGLTFTLNKNRLRHVREQHQGMKRSGKIAEVVIKSYPTEAICIQFVRNTPWTEDMKRKTEDSFEEIFRACDKTFVFVEYKSTEKNITEEAKLVMTEKLVSQLEL